MKQKLDKFNYIKIKAKVKLFMAKIKNYISDIKKKKRQVVDEG